jgi:hypothetical protein
VLGKKERVASGIVGAALLTLVVGAFVDVIPRSGIFDPPRRARLRDQIAGLDPGPLPDRAQASVLQYGLLVVFFIALVAIIAAPRSLVGHAGLLVAAATLVWLVVVRVQKR